jgi:hypothetical protein
MTQVKKFSSKTPEKDINKFLKRLDAEGVPISLIKVTEENILIFYTVSSEKREMFIKD